MKNRKERKLILDNLLDFMAIQETKLSMVFEGKNHRVLKECHSSLY